MPIERTTNFRLPIPPSGYTPWQSYYSELATVIDSVLGRFIAVGGFLGAWENSTAYTVNQKLVDTANGTVYQCDVAHTSAASPTTFAEDRTARTTLWSVWSNTAVSGGMWATGTTYSVGEFVASPPQWAVCVSAHTSGATFAADVSAGKWSVLVDLTGYDGAIDIPVSVAQGGTGSTTAAAARTALGLVIGTNVQAYAANLATIAGYSDLANISTLQGYASMANLTTLAAYASMANLTSLVGITLTAAGLALLDDTDASAQRTTLGLAIGTNVQAYDAELAALAGLTSAADKVPYFTGSGTAAVADLSVFARTFLDDANAGAVRTTLGAGTASVTVGTPLVMSPWADTTVVTQAHGLAARPTYLKCELECLNTEFGYSAGDVIDLSGSYITSTGRGFVTETDTTNVIVRPSTAPGIVDKASAGTLRVATAANWKLTVTPYLWS